MLNQWQDDNIASNTNSTAHNSLNFSLWHWKKNAMVVLCYFYHWLKIRSDKIYPWTIIQIGIWHKTGGRKLLYKQQSNRYEQSHSTPTNTEQISRMTCGKQKHAANVKEIGPQHQYTSSHAPENGTLQCPEGLD